MELKEYLKVITKFISEYKKNAHADGFVLGLSGGIDSALVLALAVDAVGKDNVFCVMMPCSSNPSDLDDALTLVKQFDVKYQIVDLFQSFNVLKESINKDTELVPLSVANIKVRLRMVTLYAIAQTRNALVLGTDNKDEYYVGYFTKYGDGGVDLLPIVHLTKAEVYEASRYYHIPQCIINKAPSAGLWDGQTDEKEMGISYEALDKYVLEKEVDENTKNRIDHLHKISEHKRHVPAKPEEYIRDEK